MAPDSENAKLIYGRRLVTGPLSPSMLDPDIPGATRNAPPIPSARRLLVVIPELYFLDHPRLAIHLRELAEEAGASIALLALAERDEDEMFWTHRLESFASRLADGAHRQDRHLPPHAGPVPGHRRRPAQDRLRHLFLNFVTAHSHDTPRIGYSGSV